MPRHEILKNTELRRAMENPVDMPLYTVHMGPEFTSTWTFGLHSPPIPAGFFGKGSDQWVGPISCVGDPQDVSVDAPTADLVVRHEYLEWIPNKDKEGPPEVPAKRNLRCDMIALSEVAKDSIEVTYDGGKKSETWDVRIDLAKRHPGGGLIYITQVSPDGNGGLADIEIAVKVAFTFSRNGEEVVLESGVEWLSETNHRFTRWLDDEMTERVHVSDQSLGSFIPATGTRNGKVIMTAGKSCNHSVTHSFILPPVKKEVRGEWGTIEDLWQFPERRG